MHVQFFLFRLHVELRTVFGTKMHPPESRHCHLKSSRKIVIFRVTGIHTRPCAKLKEAFNKDEYKLYLAVHPGHQDLLQAVVADILATGAVEKRGTAPQSGMAPRASRIGGPLG